MRLLGKAAACLAHGNQAALIVIEAEHDGAEVFTRAARVGVPANHALLPLDDFDLQPVATPLLHVRTAAALGNYAFQFALCRDFKQRFAISDVVVGIADEVARCQDGGQ